jgi:tetratricopeptide (TPR) repeat protein
MAGHRSEAIAIADNVSGIKTEHAALIDAVGSIYSLADEPSKALPLYKKAVSLSPENTNFIYNLAACQRMMGDFTAAEENCDRVIRINPQHYEAYFVRSDLKKWSAQNNHIHQMKQRLAEGVQGLRGEAYLRFALAKESEDIAEYAESFEYRASACRLQRESMRYRVEDDTETIDHVIRFHTEEALGKASSHRSCSSDEPIFVLGLPRSGTTLVERIISSHSAVYSAGELNEFAYTLVRAAKSQLGQKNLSKLQLVERSLSLDLKLLGQSYLQSTRPRTGYTPKFIDKLPLNYLYCGLIHAALPNAKIILLQRNPMDVCYAVYKTLFTLPYPFSYDLKELGTYYLAYRRLIDHWQSILGQSMLTVSYEHLVHNQEAETRRIISYCGLSWEDTCLDFQNNDTASSTASAVQVRQPIYTSSLGQWRNYENQLQPLIDIFEQHGISVE